MKKQNKRLRSDKDARKRKKPNDALTWQKRMMEELKQIKEMES
ncbi:hypothetical protein [Virgibacillus sp. AGTR]|nr:hypothetical protein [Virgibacillus sp. AGTR]